MPCEDSKRMCQSINQCPITLEEEVSHQQIEMAPISTTVIGSMPKPNYLQIPTWTKDGKEVIEYIKEYNEIINTIKPEELERQLERATREAIGLQQNAGVDIITDGELRRENYIFSFCRRLNGIDFENLRTKVCRNGAWEGKLPRIVSEISPKGNAGWLAEEWRWGQQMSEIPIKVTVPGPMTIIGTTSNEFYKNEQTLCRLLVTCINLELRKLAEAGCKNIQIDEPVLVRYPEKALEFGIDCLSQCFAGLPGDVFKTVHACCGYPQYLDQTDYEKADINAYRKIASAIDDANFDAFSIEDTHRRNDLSLFSMFKKTKVVLGVVDVVRSRVETVDEIRAHIQDVLQNIPSERLIIAPDCGLIYLPLDLAEKKLRNMVEAAKSIQ